MFGEKTVSKPSETLGDVIELNLAYLLLAQRLLRRDRAKGMRYLGVSAHVADVLANLTHAQVMMLASSNQILCRFWFNDHSILSSLSEKERAAQHDATVTTS